MTNGILITVIVCVSIHFGKACFTTGVCSGYGCPQPAMPSCFAGCSTGYSCGQYGCYARARARSSKIMEDVVNNQQNTNDVTVVSLTAERKELNIERMTNDRFYDCCVQRQLPDSCLEKCSYAMYTKNSLQAMYLRIDKCPLTALADISYCAAGGMDHTACCITNGVTTTLAGTKCLTFCDQRPGNVTKLDLTYLPCYERFENIKSCFMMNNYYKTRPAIVNRGGLARTFES